MQKRFFCAINPCPHDLDLKMNAFPNSRRNTPMWISVILAACFWDIAQINWQPPAKTRLKSTRVTKHLATFFDSQWPALRFFCTTLWIVAVGTINTDVMGRLMCLFRQQGDQGRMSMHQTLQLTHQRSGHCSPHCCDDVFLVHLFKGLTASNMQFKKLHSYECWVLCYDTSRVSSEQVMTTRKQALQVDN